MYAKSVEILKGLSTKPQILLLLYASNRLPCMSLNTLPGFILTHLESNAVNELFNYLCAIVDGCMDGFFRSLSVRVLVGWVSAPRESMKIAKLWGRRNAKQPTRSTVDQTGSQKYRCIYEQANTQRSTHLCTSRTLGSKCGLLGLRSNDSFPIDPVS